MYHLRSESILFSAIIVVWSLNTDRRYRILIVWCISVLVSLSEAVCELVYLRLAVLSYKNTATHCIYIVDARYLTVLRLWLLARSGNALPHHWSYCLMSYFGTDSKAYSHLRRLHKRTAWSTALRLWMSTHHLYLFFIYICLTTHLLSRW